MEIKNEIMGVENYSCFVDQDFFHDPILFRALSKIFLMMKKHSKKLQN
jgi:hypothetical protein